MGESEKKSLAIVRWLGLAVLGLLLSVASVARAEDVVYQKHSVVEFGDDTIEGDLSRPDGAFLEARKRFKHVRLIKVRQSFRAEILESVRNL